MHLSLSGSHSHNTFLDLQVQLQRNEVIALLNLLNRLSESINLVHERGPSIEKILEGQIVEPATQEINTWLRRWKSILGPRYVINLLHV